MQKKYSRQKLRLLIVAALPLSCLLALKVPVYAATGNTSNTSSNSSSNSSTNYCVPPPSAGNVSQSSANYSKYCSCASNNSSSNTSNTNNTNTDCSNPAATQCSSNNCDLFSSYINPIIDVLAGLVGIFVVIGIILGAVQYSASAGNPQMAAKARSRITNAIIALIAFAFLYAFLQWIIPGGLFHS